MERSEERIDNHDLAQEEVQMDEWSANDRRAPMHVAHELFNQNELLKKLLEEDISEGM